MEHVVSAEEKAIRSKRLFEPIFHDLTVGHKEEQFRLLLRKGAYPYEYMDSWEKSKRTSFAQLKHFTANSTCPELVGVTMTMCREFGKSLG